MIFGNSLEGILYLSHLKDDQLYPTQQNKAGARARGTVQHYHLVVGCVGTSRRQVHSKQLLQRRHVGGGRFLTLEKRCFFKDKSRPLQISDKSEQISQTLLKELFLYDHVSRESERQRC